MSFKEEHALLYLAIGTLFFILLFAVSRPARAEGTPAEKASLLKPGEKPVAVFALTEGDEVVAAYEYCNLHGLWKATL